MIGRAPGTIRAWEKGTSTPADAAVVSTLAAVLGIDEVTLFEAAGLDAPVTESTPSVRQALSTITPAARQAASREESLAADPAPPEPSFQPTEADQADLPAPERQRQRGPTPMPSGVGVPTAVVPAAVVPAAVVPAAQTVAAGGGAVATGETVVTEGPLDPAREPRHRAAVRKEGVPGTNLLDRLRAATARRPAAVVAPSTLPTPPRAPSYMEDPNERWSYRLRSVYTAVGVGALFIALGWAASNLLDAVGSVWEVLTSNL